MTTSLLLIALGSTLSWSAFDVVRKRLVTCIPVASLAFWISAVQIPGYLVWGLWEGDFRFEDGYAGPALMSMALNLLANVLFLEAVRRGPLSVAVPVLSFTPVFVALGSMPLLGETLGWSQWVGVTMVTFASVFLTMEPGKSPRPAELVRRFIHSPGVLHMLGVAVLWAFTPIFDKLALRHAGVGLHGVALSVSGAVGMGVYLVARGQSRTLVLPRGTVGLLALGGVTNVAALGLQFLAVMQMVVSLFEAFKRAMGVLVALFLGVVVFDERVNGTRILAAVAMALGVVLVLIG
jgi:drug/metabolite transporter (DMT)-like permease